MGHIAHFFGTSDVVSLLRRAFTALVPGGNLILAEMIADEERSEAEFALLGAIWLYGVSAEGDMFTFSEISCYLEQAGFVDTTLVSAGTEDFIKARRP
jgi:hypothetical protein